MNKSSLIICISILFSSSLHCEMLAGASLVFPVKGVQRPFDGLTRNTAPQKAGAYVVAGEREWFFQWPVPEPEFAYNRYKGSAFVRRNQESGYYACRPTKQLPKGCGRPHLGIDIYACYGTPIVAPEDGAITGFKGQDVLTPAGQESKNGGQGRVIEMVGKSGYKYTFLHTMGFAEDIAQQAGGRKDFGDTNGERRVSIPVKAGDVIAYVGRTGGIINPHLHLEVSKDGSHVDPSELFASK